MNDDRPSLAARFRNLIASKNLTLDVVCGRSRLNQEQVRRILDGFGRLSSANQLTQGLSVHLEFKDAFFNLKVNRAKLAEDAGLSINTVRECLAVLASPRNAVHDPLVESLEALMTVLSPTARIELVP